MPLLSQFGSPAPSSGSVVSHLSDGVSAGAAQLVGESGGGLFGDASAVGICVLALDPERGGYCGGQIGASTRMCTLPFDECHTVSHRSRPADFSLLGDLPPSSVSKGVFIKDKKNPFRVYTTNVLPLELLPQPIDAYSTELRPPSAWGALLRSFAERSDGQAPETMTLVADSHKAILQSPFKRQRVSDDSEPDPDLDVHVKLAHLARLIGKPGESDEPESIFGQLARFGKQLDSKDELALLDLVRSWSDTYGKQLAGLTDSAVVAIERDLDPMIQWFGKWTAPSHGGPSPICGELDRTLETMQRSIDSLQTRATGAQPPNRFFHNLGGSPHASGGPPARNGDILAKITALQKQVDSIQEQLGAEVVTVGGHSFKSKGDLAVWMQTHASGKNTFICFADPCAILNMASQMGLDNQDVMTFKSNSRKAGYENGLRAFAELSFNFALPVVFGKEAGKLGMRDSRILPDVRKPSIWDEGSRYTGLKSRILQQVSEVETVLLQAIQSEPLTPEGQRVAASCVKDSVRFISKLFEWMSHAYNSGIQDGQASQPLWEFISHCVREVFKHLHIARASGRTPNPTPVDCTWGFLQCLKLGEEFVKEEFEGHQVLSHVLNLHLQDRAVMKEEFEERLKKLEDITEEALSTAKKESPRADGGAKTELGGRRIAEAEAIKPQGLIAGIIDQKVVQKDTAIGIVASGPPTVTWYIGALGKIKWVYGPRDIPGRKADDPLWFPTSVDPSKFQGVEVLVCQGKWPPKTSPIWSIGGVRLVIRVGPLKERRGKRIPESWTVKNWVVAHNFLGGVTTGTFRVWHAVPPGVQLPAFTLRIGLANSLNQVLDPTVSSFEWVLPPTQMESNTGLGLLDWNNRFARVKAPSVFRKGVWALRKLTPRELTNVLDFPEMRSGPLGEELVEELLQNEIPGKVWCAALEPLRNWKSRKRGRAKEQQAKVFNATKRARKSQHHGDLRGDTYAPEDGDRIIEVLDSSSFKLHQSMKSEEANPEMPPEGKVSTVTDKAVKSDNAKVPTHLWNDRIASKLSKHWGKNGATPAFLFNDARHCQQFNRVMETFRKSCLKRWKKNVCKSFIDWFRKLPRELPQRNEIWTHGVRACDRALKASWWNWDGGSATFFWRWPDHYQEEARKGVAPFFDAPPPSNQDEQPPYQDEEVRQLVRSKLEAVLDKGYIEVTDIENIEAMMFMFHVPKGADDVRMVYDGSKSGLNDSLWAPWFALPTIDAMARWVIAGSWLADNDYGEQFLNFPLHPELQKYCGVDLTQLFPEWKDPKVRLLVGRWTRNAMGLKPSPYNSVQGALVAKFHIMGDPRDRENPFSWEKIVLNLPGSVNYDARQPWLMKVRHDGLLASGLVQYIDDLRIMGATEDLAWRSSSRMAKGLCYLGLQDAARKRRESTQNPGAWAGAVISTERGVFKSVTQERWEKTQGRIRAIGTALGLQDDYSPDHYDEILMELLSTGTEENGEGSGVWLHFKALESAVGFLTYVSMTYTSMVPYIKGIHLTLNGWRPNRNKWGWKVASDSQGDHGKPPERVKEVPRLRKDILALMELTAHDTPPKLAVRPSVKEPFFMVGDASGSGFGTSKWVQGEIDVEATHGNWCLQISLNSSSNFREAANLGLELRRLLDEGRLTRGSEIWVFTDNSVAESTFYRGASSSPELHQLILDLRKLEMEGNLHVHFVWIAGKRMISQGTDGLSRGDLTTGVMSGENFLKFIPLDKSAADREEGLMQAILSWLPGSWEVASPEDWFHRAKVDHSKGWVWAPPPCLARLALDELCETKHAYPQSKHVFVCPALMTGYWRKQLGKLADTMFSLKAGSTLWSAYSEGWKNGKAKCQKCHGRIKPLCGLICANYGLRLTAGKVCDSAWHGACFRQSDGDIFPCLSANDLDDTILEDGEDDANRFKEARDGDHLMVPFQCVDCHFINMKGRRPQLGSKEDEKLRMFVIRAILDSLWARESSTVASNRLEGTRFLKEMEGLGLEGCAYPARGPYPCSDVWGMGVACAVLARSLAKGRNARTIQFETVRKLRGHHANLWHTCPGGTGDTWVGDAGANALVSNAPTNSIWFKRFMIGCHKRMGDVWLPDRPLTAPIVRTGMQLLESEWLDSELRDTDRLKVASTACLVLAGYYGALRGEEIIRVDLGLMNSHWKEAMNHEIPHVPLMLSGRFKQTLGEKVFTQPLASRTRYGMNIQVWFQRIINLYEERKVSAGPLFRNEEGARMNIQDADVLFKDLLRKILGLKPKILGGKPNLEEFNIRRSLRRGATAEAQNSGISVAVIEANNRWRKHFRSKGIKPAMSMLERYTEAEASVPTLLQFSLNLRH